MGNLIYSKSLIVPSIPMLMVTVIKLLHQTEYLVNHKKNRM